jgi:hypothetical protein
MRNTVVRHFGHTPLVAGRLFFITTCFGFWISTFFLHFTQYACAIVQTLLSTDICAEAITCVNVRQYTKNQGRTSPGTCLGQKNLAVQLVPETAEKGWSEITLEAHAQAVKRINDPLL